MFTFVDLETTGKERKRNFYNQARQFAFVRTDDDLNLKEELEFRCRVQEWTLPEPGALTITGVGIGELISAEKSLYTVMGELANLLSSWGPARFVGHNLLDYDETFVRTGFYHSLRDPYPMQKGGSTRMDTLVIARVVDFLCPGALAVPVGSNGKRSFRLGDLVVANGHRLVNAHDALADAHACLWLARTIRDRAPAIWAHAMRVSDRAYVSELVYESPIFLQIDAVFGAMRTTPLTAIVQNPNQRSEAVCFDLRVDPTTLLALSPDSLAVAIARGTPKGIVRLKVNSSPMLFRTDDQLVNAVPYGDRAELAARAAAIAQNEEFKTKVRQACDLARDLWPKATEVEEMIYSGFADAAAEMMMAQFHKATTAERALLVNQFTDPRYREIARRIVAVEHPEALSAEGRERHQRFVEGRLYADGEPKWLTVRNARRELAREMLNADDNARNLLREYDAYLSELEQKRPARAA